MSIGTYFLTHSSLDDIKIGEDNTTPLFKIYREYTPRNRSTKRYINYAFFLQKQDAENCLTILKENMKTTFQEYPIPRHLVKDKKKEILGYGTLETDEEFYVHKIIIDYLWSHCDGCIGKKRNNLKPGPRVTPQGLRRIHEIQKNRKRKTTTTTTPDQQQQDQKTRKRPSLTDAKQGGASQASSRSSRNSDGQQQAAKGLVMLHTTKNHQG